MYTFIVDIRHALLGGAVTPFLVFFLYVWTVWVTKTACARRYRPFTDPEGVTAGLRTTVIVPVYNEPEPVFRAVLERASAPNNPHGDHRRWSTAATRTSSRSPRTTPTRVIPDRPRPASDAPSAQGLAVSKPGERGRPRARLRHHLGGTGLLTELLQAVRRRARGRGHPDPAHHGPGRQRRAAPRRLDRGPPLRPHRARTERLRAGRLPGRPHHRLPAHGVPPRGRGAGGPDGVRRRDARRRRPRAHERDPPPRLAHRLSGHARCAGRTPPTRGACSGASSSAGAARASARRSSRGAGCRPSPPPRRSSSTTSSPRSWSTRSRCRASCTSRTPRTGTCPTCRSSPACCSPTSARSSASGCGRSRTSSASPATSRGSPSSRSSSRSSWCPRASPPSRPCSTTTGRPARRRSRTAARPPSSSPRSPLRWPPCRSAPARGGHGAAGARAPRGPGRGGGSRRRLHLRAPLDRPRDPGSRARRRGAAVGAHHRSVPRGRHGRPARSPAGHHVPERTAPFTVSPSPLLRSLPIDPP